VVAETFQLRINIYFSLTDGAPKAPPSASRKPLALMVLRQKSKSQILNFLGGKSNINFVFYCNFIRHFFGVISSQQFVKNQNGFPTHKLFLFVGRQFCY
jgi:hypothetical protein